MNRVWVLTEYESPSFRIRALDLASDHRCEMREVIMMLALESKRSKLSYSLPISFFLQSRSWD
jgi:hypothetical protein